MFWFYSTDIMQDVTFLYGHGFEDMVDEKTYVFYKSDHHSLPSWNTLNYSKGKKNFAADSKADGQDNEIWRKGGSSLTTANFLIPVVILKPFR